MNIRVFKFVTVLVFVFTISSGTKTNAAILKLTAKPVVFINTSKILFPKPDQIPGSLEMANLKEKQDKICAQRQLGVSVDVINSEMAETGKTVCNLMYKVRLVATEIARELGACAVLRYHPYNSWDDIFCVDLDYDISDEVIDRLNQEYLSQTNTVL